MKERKINLSRFSVFCLIIVLLSALLIPRPIEAKTVSKATVRSAYEQFLSKHPSKTFGDKYYDVTFSPKNKTFVNRFIIHDINNDGIEELFTFTNVNCKWTIIRGYRYDAGKVKELKFKDGKNVVFNDCATAAGRWYFYICNKGHIHNEWYGGWLGESKYVYSKYGKGIRKYLSYENDCLLESTKVFRYGKRISEDRFITLTEKCVKKKSNGYLNSKKNRKKLREMTL